MKNAREYWIDAVKLLACTLVAVGHLFQSLVKSGVISSGALLSGFDQTIYTFHVSLFFICSGYLYQKHAKGAGFSFWRENAKKKLIVLGVPYVVFTCVSWLMKTIFSADVNKQVGSLFGSLFISPIQQYWYLYCLFLIFLVTPVARRGKEAAALLVLSIGLRLLQGTHAIRLYALSIVMEKEWWFVLGMCAAAFDIRRIFHAKATMYVGCACITAFMLYSVLCPGAWSALEKECVGFTACAGIILAFGYVCESGCGCRCIQKLCRYTMPVYLMHTLFAAACRILLLRLGIHSAALHILCGLAVSFAGPVIAEEILCRSRWTVWILHPQNLYRPSNTKGGSSHVRPRTPS